MRPAVSAVVIVVAVVCCRPALAVAQEPVRAFDQLNTRLKPGDRIRVTDVRGREAVGKLQRLAADALTLELESPTTFAAPDVRTIHLKTRDSLKNGTLIGLAVGGGLAAAWCGGAVAEDSPEIDAGVECAEGLIVFGGIGTLIGLGIDALIPGKGLEVYRAPVASDAHARFSIAPMISPRRKGIALSFAF